ncbi:MAG: hypothetical protein GY821_05945, partial [Gammaproteobacteria bacterium]|nr:hypothetical protein [Gammaproteobacteria bacterium]
QLEGNNNNNNMKFVAAPQLNRNFGQRSPENRSQKVIECCDKQNALHSVSQEPHQVDYSLSNRPNENQREMLREFEPGSRSIGEIVNDSVQINIQKLSDCLEKIEERLSISNAKMEKVVTDMKELSEVVDHDIMKRDQESERFNQKLLEEDKTTDKFKHELSDSKDGRQSTSSELSDTKDCRQLTSSNHKELSDITSLEKMEPGPCVKSMPIQCVNPRRFRINVEGQLVNFVEDSGVGSSIVVPERVANQILARKFKTLYEFLNSMAPTNSNVQINSCTGGDGPIVGQAMVTMKNGKIECPTEMLVMRTDNKQAQGLIGNDMLSKLGLALASPEQNTILELNVADTPPRESSRMIDAPVKLPKTVHTPVSLQECHSIAQMDMEGSNNDCSSNDLTESVQQEISTSRDAVVVTKDSASPLELEQVSTELKLNGHYQRQQRVLRQ